MDLINMIYSTYTVGEHFTETKWNVSGNNGVFCILKPGNFTEINICPDNPALPQDLNDTVLEANGLVWHDIFNKYIWRTPYWNQVNPFGYKVMYFIRKAIDFAKINILLMKPDGLGTSTIKFSNTMDLLYTVGKHPTESKWNASGNNGVFRILKLSNYA